MAEVLNLKETADFFGVEGATITNWVGEKRIKPIKSLPGTKFSRVYLEAFISNGLSPNEIDIIDIKRIEKENRLLKQQNAELIERYAKLKTTIWTAFSE